MQPFYTYQLCVETHHMNPGAPQAAKRRIFALDLEHFPIMPGTITVAVESLNLLIAIDADGTFRRNMALTGDVLDHPANFIDHDTGEMVVVLPERVADCKLKIEYEYDVES